MSQFKPDPSDVIDCIDIFAELKASQWLVQSMQDAIETHWGEEELIEHIAYLVSIYGDKIQDLIPRLDAAFDKVYRPQISALDLV
jgi:hypothetical protein